MKKENWIVRLVMAAYRVDDDEVRSPDFIIPHGYSLLNASTIPDASKKALAEAARIAKMFPDTKIVFSGSNYFPGWTATQENELKLAFLEQQGIPMERVIVTAGIANTVQEVQKTMRVIPTKGKGLIVITDRMHTRCTRAMWKKLAPGARICVRSVTGCYTAEYPVTLQKSPLRWLVANLLRHFLFILLGEKIGQIQHPIKKNKG